LASERLSSEKSPGSDNAEIGEKVDDLGVPTLDHFLDGENIPEGFDIFSC